MMKVLFKNITYYNKEKYNELLEFHKDKFGIKIIATTLAMIVFAIYIIIENIIHKNWKIFVLIIVLGVIAYLIEKIFHNSKNKRNNNKKSENEKKYIYTFYKYFFKVKAGKKREIFFYFRLYKIFETEDEFYLYLDEDHSLIVSKTGFKMGNSKEFSKFIKRKCILKYKNETK